MSRTKQMNSDDERRNDANGRYNLRPLTEKERIKRRRREQRLLVRSLKARGARIPPQPGVLETPSFTCTDDGTTGGNIASASSDAGIAHRVQSAAPSGRTPPWSSSELSAAEALLTLGQDVVGEPIVRDVVRQELGQPSQLTFIYNITVNYINNFIHYCSS